MKPIGQGSPGAGGELARAVVEIAAARGLRIAVAESLTGGLLADALVSVPGSSRVFSGGVVAYDTALKHSVLGVDDELLREKGPVDGEVARQMARGVRELCAVPRADGAEPESADIGLATTGVAGPEPDPQTGQPVGTVWVGLCLGDRARSVEYSLSGDRGEIRNGSVAAALELLVGELGASELESD
ncbi:damage-inducible protein CinA [Leucobacter sp. UCD-THU]|uniref:CinA family protein n=1 Tax=Leucobacter sp. UCD-THU TaxID=1292023 RepID=UPI000375BBA8|nr:CinA family protein [Leucobacter sp. UCD-THU]EYT51650.1 damage-inducible protein CinA [Leucobacter sp. UCD-THU]